ncbi:hypothetical protein OROMI_012639 [Orobanche minor]
MKVMLLWYYTMRQRQQSRKRKRSKRYSMIKKIPKQIEHLSSLVREDDIVCVEQLRMDKNAFGRLCQILRNADGLQDEKPEPITEDSVDPVWRYFPGCLGAIDGTHVKVRVPLIVKNRYRSQKGEISTNVLAVYDRNMNFVYVLAGWEGLVANSRVLRDAISREPGLQVPTGCFYLGDGCYANCEGFLTPYRGIRYHLSEWGEGDARPRNCNTPNPLRDITRRKPFPQGFTRLVT